MFKLQFLLLAFHLFLFHSSSTPVNPTTTEEQSTFYNKIITDQTKNPKPNKPKSVEQMKSDYQELIHDLSPSKLRPTVASSSISSTKSIKSTTSIPSTPSTIAAKGKSEPPTNTPMLPTANSAKSTPETTIPPSATPKIAFPIETRFKEQEQPDTEPIPAENAIKTLEEETLPSSIPISSKSYVTRMVHVVTRHGQRTPRHILPNDAQSVWPNGLEAGELTNKGSQDMQALGTQLKKKYVDELKLLHSTYQKQDVYVRSSDVDRCLQSAHALLHGLFPTGPAPPIHSIPQGEEFLLRGYDHCHKFNEYVQATLNSDQMQASVLGDTPLFHKMERLTGVRVSVSNLKPVTDTILIVDELAHAKFGEEKIQNGIGFMGSDSMNSTSTSISSINLSDRDMARIHELHDQINYVIKSNRAMSRLMVGNLLREILERKAQYIKGIKDSMGHGPPAFILYSAHDTTLMGLLTAFGVVDQYGKHTPITSSHMEIELLEVENKKNKKKSKKKNQNIGDFYVRIAFNGNVIRLGGCTTDVCPIATVAEYLNAVVPSTLIKWSLECDNTKKDIETSNRDSIGELFDNGGYMGLDYIEWSQMAIFLSFILVLMNVMFDHIVIQYFFERSQLQGVKTPINSPLKKGSHTGRGVVESARKSWEGGNGSDFSNGNGNDNSNGNGGKNGCCCNMSKRSVVCGITSGGFISLCFVFLIAFGAGWQDWPNLCFCLVFLITMEAILMVGVTMYTRCLKPLDEYGSYRGVPTNDYSAEYESDGDGVMSATL